MSTQNERRENIAATLNERHVSPKLANGPLLSESGPFVSGRLGVKEGGVTRGEFTGLATLLFVRMTGRAARTAD